MNEVKEEESHISDFGCEGTESRHMWTEPKNDQASAFYLDASFEKAFKIDDISSVFHYELIAENGGLNSYTTGERKGELSCRDFDGMLHEDEITKLPLTVIHSNASEDHYLDVDFAKEVPDLDCKFYDDLSFGNSKFETHSPGNSNEVIGVSESSILTPKCFNDQFGEATVCRMHDISGSKCGCEIPVEDKLGLKCSLTCDVQDVQQTNDVQGLLEIGSSLYHNQKNSCFLLTSAKASCASLCVQYDEASPVSQCTEAEDLSMDDMSTDSCAEMQITRTRQRRLCKPPQRFLEGSPWLKSRHQRAKKHATSSLKGKDLGVRFQKKHRRKPLERKTSKASGSNLEPDSDEEYEPIKSSFNVRKSKRGDRRKNNKLWTLAEVVKLVDGISQFGIGQWTAVKRTFFSSSCRTATDIRDKWRNLVKSNCRSSKEKREDDQHLRNGSQSLPNRVMERVRELANAPVSKCKSKRGRKLSDSRSHDISPLLPE